MKTALLFLFISIALLVVLFLRTHHSFGKNTIDLHVHDTYYVLSYLTLAIIILLFAGTFFSLGGAIGTSFKNKFFIILLTCFVLADGFVIYKYIRMFD